MDYYLGILAGGRSNRFGSNKAIFRIDGIALISRFLMEVPKLNPSPKEVLISLHELDQFPEVLDAIKLDIKLVKKTEFEFMIKSNGKNQTPLKFLFDENKLASNHLRAAIVGFQTVFNYINDGFVQILPCDTPYFDAKIMNYILELCKASQWKWEAIIPKWQNGFIEPLNSMYKVESFKQTINKNILKNELRISNLFDEKKDIFFLGIEKELSEIDPNSVSFKNLNRKDFLKEI